MKKPVKVLLGLLGLVLALVLWDIWAFHYHTPGWEPEFSSASPDGLVYRFSI